MVLISLDYKNLEREVIDAEKVPTRFNQGQLELRVGIKEGKPTIDVVLPWGNIFTIGSYDSEEKAREEYAGYLKRLEEGYGIAITDGYSAEIAKF